MRHVAAGVGAWWTSGGWAPRLLGGSGHARDGARVLERVDGAQEREGRVERRHHAYPRAPLTKTVSISYRWLRSAEYRGRHGAWRFCLALP